MKSVTLDYFKMMDGLLSPLPLQYRALAESSKGYEEGQQFADFVRLQQSTLNQAMIPTYHFEKYRGEGIKRLIFVTYTVVKFCRLSTSNGYKTKFLKFS